MTTRAHAWYGYFEKFPLGKWAKIDISWKKKTGLALYMNGKFVTRVVKKLERTKKISVSVKSSLFIGRASTTSTEFKFGKFVIEEFKYAFSTKETIFRAGIEIQGEKFLQITELASQNVLVY